LPKKEKIKRELTSLQKTIFEKKDNGTNFKIEIRKEELLQRLANPTSNPTDPKQLASLIKTELREVLEGREPRSPMTLSGEY